MKLLKIKLVNFRRFIDEEINLNPRINLFVGRNNSGKSTILEAIGLALSYPGMGGIELNKTVDTGTCVVNLLLTFEQEDWSTAIKLVRHEYRGKDEIKVALSSEILEKLAEIHINIDWTKSFADGTVTSSSRIFRIDPLDLNGLDMGVRQIIQRTLNNLNGQNIVQVFKSTTYLTTERRLQTSEKWMPYNQLITRADANAYIRNRLLNLRRRNLKKYEELRDQIVSIFGIEDIDVSKDWDTGELDLIITDRGKGYDIGEMGSGTKSFIYLFSYLYLSGMHIALIDEPDINMHPMLVGDLVDFLRTLSKETQLILTSHNKFFIDPFNEDEIYRVEYFGDIGSKVQRLDSQLERWSLLEHLGITLSTSEKAEGAFAEITVFTEGASDIEYIKKFAVKIGKEQEFIKNKPLFIPIEGSTKRRSNVDPEIFDKIWVEKSGVTAPFLLILDRDEFTQGEIERDIDHYGENRIHHLNRREIENYMLDPKAILKLLRDRAERYGRQEDIIDTLKEMTEDDILMKISELIEKGRLRHKVRMLRFLKKFHHLHFIPYDDISNLIDESHGKTDSDIINNLLLRFHERASEPTREDSLKILEKVTMELDEEWENKKLILCPGKDLFTLINEWTEEEYKITFPPKEVIDYLHHVDEDIINLINKILIVHVHS